MKVNGIYCSQLESQSGNPCSRREYELKTGGSSGYALVRIDRWFTIDARCAAKGSCLLLTETQVSSVLGNPAKPGHVVPDDTTACNWPLLSLAKMTAKDTKEVEVKILDSQSWALIQLAAASATKVEGVGDYAVYLGDSDLMNLYVKKGNVELSVNVHGFPIDQVKEKEKTLAKALLANL